MRPPRRRALLGLLWLAACTTGRKPQPLPPPVLPPHPEPVTLPAVAPCPPLVLPTLPFDQRPEDLRRGDEAFDQGELTAAAAAYDAFLRHAMPDVEVPRVLARMVVLCSLPPTRDPVAAREYHQRLVTEYPRSPFRAEADLLLRAGTDFEAQKHRGQELEKEVARLNQLVEKLKKIDLAPREPPD